MIHVAQDDAGIRLALIDLLEESFRRDVIKPALAHAQGEQRERLLRSLPDFKLAAGYYVWASFLYWLETQLSAGARMGDMSAAEVQGLAVLNSARTEWECEHPRCGKCGARQHGRLSLACRECGVKFDRGVKR